VAKRKTPAMKLNRMIKDKKEMDNRITIEKARNLNNWKYLIEACKNCYKRPVKH
jgi:hypothetical protein